MSDKPKKLLNELIRFIKDEEEIYGPFSVSVVDENAQYHSQSQDAEDKTIQQNTKSELKDESEAGILTVEQKLEACSTLDELKNLCDSSVDLKTDLDDTNLVFGVGNPDADLLIVGEAPGQQEDFQGEPFVGAAGQLLNKILAAIDFDRDDIYIANILKHRPPGNRNPTAEERQRSLPFLMRQIDLISPKLILCLGKVSGTTLLNKDEALKRMRGKFYPFRGAELTVTYHPAALLRNPKWKRPVWEDVQKVKKRYDELGCKP